MCQKPRNAKHHRDNHKPHAYKKRRKPTKVGSKDRSYRQGHNYEDFQDYIKEHPDTNVVEMDCVEGKKGESKAILTFTFRNCNLMLMFLLEYQDQ